MNAIEIDHLGKSFYIQGKSKFPTLMEMGRRFFSGSNAVNHEDSTFWAFRDVSFSVKQGERVGIIGSNGSGKTTLLRVLARIIFPTAGKAYLNGRVGSIIEIGSGFHPELTGRENTYLNGVIMGMGISAIKNKFNQIVSFADVEKFIDTPIKYYSSGMYLRLAFSIAAHLDVDIYLLDEVMAVGDEAFQKRCYEKLLELSSKGCTMLTVSHDLRMVQQLCNKVVYLEKGKQIVVSYDVEGVIKQYTGSP